MFDAVINFKDKPDQEFLFASEFLSKDQPVKEGHLVTCLTTAWREIYAKLESDAELFFQFSENPEKFEEFIAGAYSRDGYKVTLTPRSGDGGKDIIAEKSGFGAVRILDQCKAYSKGRKVGQNDVRALIGVLGTNLNASKAVLTTTSAFAPGIEKDPQIQSMLPYRLELRDGKDLKKWLGTLDKDDT